jgi:hypothetical protein
MPARWKALLVVASLAAASCNDRPTVIDGSSAQAFEESIEKARRDLPIKDRLTFDAALNTVGGRRYADKDPDATARDLYNGMTAADVVADAHARGIE